MLDQGGFDVEISRNMAEFFSTTLIRNFEGYRYVMNNLPVEKLDKRILAIQTPLAALPPLDSQLKGEELAEASLAASSLASASKAGSVAGSVVAGGSIASAGTKKSTTQ